MCKNRGFYNGRIGNIMKVICQYFLFNGKKLAQNFDLVRACSDFTWKVSDCEELVARPENN
mgnify:CR=1 FL=1